MSSLDAQAMMDRAREAQQHWGRLSVGQRCFFIGKLRQQIAAECESIAGLIAEETSKPPLDALSGDVLVTLEMMRYYESRAAKILRKRRTGKPAFLFFGARFEQHYEPHGVALIFGASNYPLQLTLVPAITALAAGNAVVLKCSERTPKTAGAIRRLFEAAGFPAGLTQIVCDGPEESQALIDARPDILFFTGSSRNGQQVAERAARHLVPAILELGGKDPSLVFADCHLKRAVEGVVYGAFSNGGRVCVGVKRVYVEVSICDEFVDQLVQRMAALRVGQEEDCDFRPSAIEVQSPLHDQINDALQRGAKLLYPKDRSAFGCAPILLSEVPTSARILTEETFGPVLCIARFADEAEALALANGSAFALSGSVWTGDRRRARRVSRGLSGGSCAVNDVIRVIANPHSAFGGNGQSGYGRYHGPEGLRAFSRIKTVMFASDRRKREINWFPFTSRTRKGLASFIRASYGGGNVIRHLSRILFPLLLSAAIIAPLPAQSRQETQLSIKVRLTDHAHGEVGYLIFGTAAGFPGDKGKAVRHGFVPIPANATELSIDTSLPPGNYAVSIYEDLNGNHKLDHNLIGIPKEPVGVSNNPPAHMRPPRFDECSFRVGASEQAITINVVSAL